MKVLELESQLSSERQRLGELRKKHYELAGVPLDQTVGRDFDDFVSILPPVMPEAPLPEPPKVEPPKIPPSKKNSIFQKSGSLLKNKVPDRRANDITEFMFNLPFNAFFLFTPLQFR